MNATSAPETSIWHRGRLGRSGIQGEPRLIFGQVREDAAVEVALLRARSRTRRVCVIASAGCTAFALRAALPPTTEICAIDINAAQIYLCAWKQAALQTAAPSELIAALDVDARPLHVVLTARLPPEVRAFWDAHPSLLARGLNHSGVIDRRMEIAMRIFFATTVSRRTCRQLLESAEPAEQLRWFLARWDGWRWRAIFRLLLSRPALRSVYGRQILTALPVDFPTIIRERIERSLLATPGRANPYAWQTFLGRYASHEDAARPPYLQNAALGTLRDQAATLTFVCADLVKWLEAQPARSVDFFALANILEAAPPRFKSQLLTALHHAAAPEATVIFRSILAPPEPEGALSWLRENTEESLAATRQDRSGVCAGVNVYRRCD